MEKEYLGFKPPSLCCLLCQSEQRETTLNSGTCKLCVLKSLWPLCRWPVCRTNMADLTADWSIAGESWTPGWQEGRGSCSFRLHQPCHLPSVSHLTLELRSPNAAAFLTSTLGIWPFKPKYVPHGTHQPFLPNTIASTQPFPDLPSSTLVSRLKQYSPLFLFVSLLKHDSRIAGDPKGSAFKNDAKTASVSYHLSHSDSNQTDSSDLVFAAQP